MERARPPDDIAPHDFFTRWIAEAVSGDDRRRARLGDTEASIEFELAGEGGGVFCVSISGGRVYGTAGSAAQPDLRVQTDVETWRALNRGELSAPEALLRRRVKLAGNLLLGLKLHLILG
ncbi:hypothetical protein MYXO_00830 [Myxococcaceae bacterium]|nr:hypothetical protein MYXO_00830 [Myxococcaceae bacterium]